jgi:endoglycosylceramidase
MLFRLALLCLLCAACQSNRTPPSFAACQDVAPEPSTPVPAPLHTDGAFFKDQSGRVVLLRGVNVAGNAKVPPFSALRSAADLDPLPGWGINTLRLLFTWEAFEPQPCGYAEGYLASIEREVTWAEERGLYVFVDFHQDGFSRFSLGGCGEGFPEWAVLSSLATHAPDNGPRCDGWGVKLTFDGANLDVWRGFHRDLEGARTRYLQMVGRVAARLSKHPNVIGYEVINEPWGQTWELHDLFEDVGAALRAQDPDRVLFIPAHALGLNAPRVSHQNIVHAPHYYDNGVYLSKAWAGGSVAGPLDEMRKVSQGWGTPMLLGEFGANEGSRDEAGYLEAIYGWLDEHFVSATQWNYTPGWDPVAKDGFDAEDYSIVDEHLALRSGLFVPRPYPQKTAGVPLAFQRDAKGFTYRWAHDPALGATEVFVLEGQQVVSHSGAPVDCVLSGHLLSCTGSAAGEVSVTVSAP